MYSAIPNDAAYNKKVFDIWNLGGTSAPLNTGATPVAATAGLGLGPKTSPSYSKLGEFFGANQTTAALPKMSADLTNSYKYVPNMTPPPSNPGTGWVNASPVDPSKALVPYTAPSTGGGVKGAAKVSKGSGMFGNLFSPNLGANLKGTFGKLANPQFNWTKGGGIQGWGKNLGGWATGLNAGMDALSAAQGISDISEANKTSEDIMADITAAAYNSPTIQYDLNAKQLETLRDIQRGTYDAGGDFSDVDLLGALTGAVPDALMGLMYGGIPGAIAGGLGSAVNSGIGDWLGATQQSNAELEALYQAVLESEQQHKNARKQRAYENLVY